MRFKYTAKKPSRDQLWGMSPSQFNEAMVYVSNKIKEHFGVDD